MKGEGEVGTVRILVVDDEPSIRKTLSTNLARHGYDVDTAETGYEALGDCEPEASAPRRLTFPLNPIERLK